MNFDAYFRIATGFGPMPWQCEVASDGLPEVLSVPTGLGKTEGAVLAWSWRRLHQISPTEPRHLIYCLPMRVLVRQTADRLLACFDRLARAGTGPEVSVFQLMGGDIAEDWEGQPDREWVLVGTQDQLLSRALNRGYCASPFVWPMHFGILNNDCQWILDEVQLMGPGLWTSSQLDWVRSCRFGTIGPTKTTWMSATLDTSFLDTRDRRDDGVHQIPPVRMAWEIPREFDEDARRHMQRLRDARRSVEVRIPPKKAARTEWLAGRVVEAHQPGTLSLVVCNTVTVAQQVFRSLETEVPKILLTSRFRGVDRSTSESRLTEFEERRKAARTVRVDEDPGLICVSTQVVEAGVDVSAHRLWSEAAPWPSVVQRLGRMNRDGRDNDAHACFLPPDRITKGSDRIGPYPAGEVQRGGKLVAELARLSVTSTYHEAIAALGDGPKSASIAEALAPQKMPHPRAADIHGLFSSEPDVFGGFTDISEFVRSPDPNPDVTVFWRAWNGKRPDASELDGPPFDARNEGCSVAVSRLAKLLGDKSLAWRWESDRRGAGSWIPVRGSEVRPGMALMLEGGQGGYDVQMGWTGRRADVIADLPPPGQGARWDDEADSESEYWASLASHLGDAGEQARLLVAKLGLPEELERSVIDAARFHDLGKAHPVWQAALPGRTDTTVLAKCPPVLAVTVEASRRNAVRSYVETLLGDEVESLEPRFDGRCERLRWALQRKLTRSRMQELRGLDGVMHARHEAFRPGLRHEAASALAMWAARREYGLSGLAVYLSACHHGKVRTVLRSRTGEDVCGVPWEPSELKHNGTWRLAFEIAADGAAGEWREDGFRVTAPGWTGLVAELLGPARPQDAEPIGAVDEDQARSLGPFRLAYLEALVRVADWRASGTPTGAWHPGSEDVV
jgi:CRISPR-associated endonuclease/helicase Cas3